MNTPDFKTQLASDLDRDGFSFELLHNDEVVAEVFLAERDYSLTFTSFAKALPLSVIEEFITKAKKRLHHS